MLSQAAAPAYAACALQTAAATRRAASRATAAPTWQRNALQRCRLRCFRRRPPRLRAREARHRRQCRRRGRRLRGHCRPGRLSLLLLRSRLALRCQRAMTWRRSRCCTGRSCRRRRRRGRRGRRGPRLRRRRALRRHGTCWTCLSLFPFATRSAPRRRRRCCAAAVAAPGCWPPPRRRRLLRWRLRLGLRPLQPRTLRRPKRCALPPKSPPVARCRRKAAGQMRRWASLQPRRVWMTRQLRLT